MKQLSVDFYFKLPGNRWEMDVKAVGVSFKQVGKIQNMVQKQSQNRQSSNIQSKQNNQRQNTDQTKTCPKVNQKPE